MRPRIAKWMWLAAVLLATTLGFRPIGSDGDPEEEKIASLIEQLGDATFAKREAASKALADLDERALPIVRSAADANPDAEIRGRAAHAVRDIMQRAATSKSTGMKLALIEGGEFRMGSDERRRRFRFTDEFGHPVALTEPYLMGVYEVTQNEYRQVMKAEPSAFSKTGESRDAVAGLDTSRFPVEQVSWFDAVAFCDRLSELDGYRPFYDIKDVKREKGSITSARVTIAGGNGYRLPTEAQWEYACRAGTPGRFHYGEVNTGIEANLQSYTNFGNDPRFQSLDRPTRVGSYAPNAWGLYDMHGNIGEWCWDWYDEEYYTVSPLKDPAGPDRGDQRVLRSGSWNRSENGCQSSSRFCLTPDDRRDYTGFRVCRMP